MVQVREHIASTEGPEGLHAELLAQAPRLANAVSRLVSEHEALTQGAGPARRTGQVCTVAGGHRGCPGTGGQTSLPTSADIANAERT